MTNYRPVKSDRCLLALQFFFFPVCLSSLLWPVTSSPLQRGDLYLAAHTPAGSHYSVNALDELNLPPSLPQMAHLSLLAKKVGCFLKKGIMGKGSSWRERTKKGSKRDKEEDAQWERQRVWRNKQDGVNSCAVKQPLHKVSLWEQLTCYATLTQCVPACSNTSKKHKKNKPCRALQYYTALFHCCSTVHYKRLCVWERGWGRGQCVCDWHFKHPQCTK